MDKLRELALRGTPDCPLARYHLTRKGTGTMTPIHWHPEQEILYMHRGEAELLSGRTTIRLSSGDIAFVPPGELHAIKASAVGCEYDAFVFSLDLITLPEAHFFQQQLVLPLRDSIMRLPALLRPGEAPYPAVAAALDAACTCSKTAGNYKLTVFSSIMAVCTALWDYLEPNPAGTLHQGNETVKDCLRYMDAHFSERLTLRHIAHQVHLHPNYLCSLFKDYTGQTVFQQLTHIRVEKAADLMRKEHISISQAAALCGFDSASFFSKKFKEIMGATPKEYRKQHR